MRVRVRQCGYETRTSIASASHATRFGFRAPSMPEDGSEVDANISASRSFAKTRRPWRTSKRCTLLSRSAVGRTFLCLWHDAYMIVCTSACVSIRNAHACKCRNSTNLLRAQLCAKEEIPNVSEMQSCGAYLRSSSVRTS